MVDTFLANPRCLPRFFCDLQKRGASEGSAPARPSFAGVVLKSGLQKADQKEQGDQKPGPSRDCTHGDQLVSGTLKQSRGVAAQTQWRRKDVVHWVTVLSLTKRPRGVWGTVLWYGPVADSEKVIGVSETRNLADLGHEAHPDQREPPEQDQDRLLLGTCPSPPSCASSRCADWWGSDSQLPHKELQGGRALVIPVSQPPVSTLVASLY